MIQVDGPKVLRELDSIAGTKPEGYVYDSSDGCYNTEFDETTQEWKPSCIVGQFFVKVVGVTPSDDWRIGDFTTTSREFDHLVEFTPDAKFYLHAAQVMQDSRMPWSKINGAIRELRHLSK